MTGGPEKSPSKSKAVSGGGRIEEWMIGVVGEGRDANQMTTPSKATHSAAQAMRSRMRRPTGSAGAAIVPDCDVDALLEPIQRSSRATSPALCQRASESFARQPRTT